MDQGLDDKAMRSLMEESQDLHSDAMRTAKEPLDGIVEIGRERRASGEYAEQMHEERHPGRRAVGVAAGAVAGTALLAAGARGAFAAGDDVAALQTAASLENLAVSTYGAALTLPYIKSGNAVVKAFATMTMKQHSQHADAFNAKVAELGGQKQTNPDPKYAPVVQQMLPQLKAASSSTGPPMVVKLAATLETVATETYVKNIQTVSDKTIRLLFGTIAGVESQHLATLLAVQALLQNNLGTQIALPPPDLSKLPMQTANLAIPDTFLQTSMASPPSEGAVK